MDGAVEIRPRRRGRGLLVYSSTSSVHHHRRPPSKALGFGEARVLYALDRRRWPCHASPGADLSTAAVLAVLESMRHGAADGAVKHVPAIRRALGHFGRRDSGVWRLPPVIPMISIPRTHGGGAASAGVLGAPTQASPSGGPRRKAAARLRRCRECRAEEPISTRCTDRRSQTNCLRAPAPW